MSGVNQEKLRSEGKVLLAVGAILVALHAALTAGQTGLQSLPWSSMNGVLVQVLSSVTTILLLAAPILLSVGFVLFRLGGTVQADSFITSSVNGRRHE